MTNDAKMMSLTVATGEIGIDGVSRRRILGWIRTGVLTPSGVRLRLPASRVGGKWMVRRTDVKSFIAKLTSEFGSLCGSD